MQLSSVEVRDFRNLEAVDLVPHPRFNVLAGENGQGKTNFLAALYWLATLRPLRATRLRELVRWGAGGARVAAHIEAEGLTHQLEVIVRQGKREAKRAGKPAKARDYFGALSVVVFTPDDVGLVRGAPSDRRRLLDRAVFNSRPAHLEDAVAYRRALDARNALLRDVADDAMVEAYEAVLARHGARLVASRRSYVEALAPRFEATFASIAGAELGGTVSYRPSLDVRGDELAVQLAAAWRDERDRDRQRGFTQRGPHVDDLVLKLLDRPAKAYASQGQQRAMVLALRIAEIELLQTAWDRIPVLLLDDVSSELDPQRTARLFEFLEQFGGQVFITTTDPNFLRIAGERRTFVVEGGRITEEQ